MSDPRVTQRVSTRFKMLGYGAQVQGAPNPTYSPTAFQF